MSLLRVLHEVVLRSTEVATNCTEVVRRIIEVASEGLK